MRAIDGDALRDRLQNLGYDDWNQGTTTTWAEAFIECADMVDEQPTIEPERKKGYWIKGKMWSEGIGMGETYGFYYTCSECNSSVQGGYNVCGKNFCEKCGADNREDGSANADVES